MEAELKKVEDAPESDYTTHSGHCSENLQQPSQLAIDIQLSYFSLYSILIEILRVQILINPVASLPDQAVLGIEVAKETLKNDDADPEIDEEVGKGDHKQVV